MYTEMRKGKTTPHGGLYISMAHLGPEKVRRDFKGMVERCADCGFDLAGGLVEVVPTAHYMMGGVEFHSDCSTDLPGLFVAGEDAGGVHGANRLGGNGVANSTVFGALAGDAMARWVQSADFKEPQFLPRSSLSRAPTGAASSRFAKGCTTSCGTRSASSATQAASPRARANWRRSKRPSMRMGSPTIIAPSTSPGTTG
jgi:succinate dehydrogenase/fumarate reductase flavoprotein subunit